MVATACTLSGANARLALKREATFGAKPSGNFAYVPFISADIGGTDDLDETAVLGDGRDQQRPARDGLTVRGRLVVPLELNSVGFWLNAALGDDTVTGTTNYTHTFKSGQSVLPTFFAEFQHLDAPTPIYRGYSGLVVDTVGLTLGPTGRPRLELGVTARDEEEDNTSDAGTPTSAVRTYFHNKQAFINKDTIKLGSITALTLNMNNNFDFGKYIGDGGLVGCAVPGQFNARGSLTGRFVDRTIAQLAENATVMELGVGWQIDATHAITFLVEQAELLRAGRPVSGPGAIERSFNLYGSKETVANASVTAVLINQVAAAYSA